MRLCTHSAFSSGLQVSIGLHGPGKISEQNTSKMYSMTHAGASQHAAVEEVSAEVAEKMFQLNVLGPIALTRAALPFLLSRRHCRIVVVSSMAAVVPAPGQAIYSGTKLALHGYFSTLQSELNDRSAFGQSPLQGSRQACCMKRIHSSAGCTVHMEPVKSKQTVAGQGGPHQA